MLIRRLPATLELALWAMVPVIVFGIWLGVKAALNIRWFEDLGYRKSITTYVKNPHTNDKKALLLNGEPKISGPYERFYQPYLARLK